MAVSNAARQAKHRAKHPDREKARQAGKYARSRRVSGKLRVAPKQCAMKGRGPCGGKVEGHHVDGYGSSRLMYLCKRHHEQVDKQS